ncbi:hypothetical protein BKA93DRAFT_802692 [Sparassis latifolia]|uniref:Protein-S-isoprenylcysteine O-methyltransferase n=1 Tax=Sparassis crispa TaxID=139825 RepID=A0A401G8N1_9APHY|nr:hypothetical protein SCP_0114060 [Sparassis crispa]GBE78517.1 hypothetical protein SCP_0114060 [Sparassis crispa]
MVHYLAGLNLSLSPSQHVEAIVTASVLGQVAATAWAHRNSTSLAKETTGPVKTLPKAHSAAWLALPAHGFSSLLPPVLYLSGVLAHNLEQPEWLRKFSLPGELDDVFHSSEGRAVGVVRVLASIVSVGVGYAATKTVRALGGQWHYIGIREKAQVVSTGPYAIVRHPLYSLILVQEFLMAGMFWSYIPLVALPITALAFAVKVPVEEKLIEDDENTGPAYVEYKKKVTARLIPWLW